MAAPSASAAPSLSGRAWYGLPTTMTLTTPQVYANVPVTFTATLNNTIVSGTVSFWQNEPGNGVAGLVAVVNGKASLTWTPAYAWPSNWQTFGATFFPDPQQGTTLAQASTNPMHVLPNLGQDPVTFAPLPLTVTAGRTVAFTAATASGSAVALSVTGPCTLSSVGTNSATIIAGAAGSCTLSAASNGGGPYLASSASTTVTVSSPPVQKPPKKKPAKKK